MSSTKIINVLKDDSFPEILDLFKSTPAEEVIFVLPKSAKAFKKEDHFASLKDEAKSLGKSVSFLCSSPELNDLAKKYKFDVLLARSPAPRKTHQAVKPNSINVVNQIEEFYAEPALDTDSISTSKPISESNDLDFEDSPAEAFAPVVASVAGQNDRRLDDIFVPEAENQHNVKVSGGREKTLPIEVNGSSQKVSLMGWLNDSRKSLSNFSIKSTPSKPTRTSRSPAHRTALISLACVAVVILGIVVFVTTGKAQVTIKPTSQPLDVSLNVFTSDNTSAVSVSAMAIPGQLFNIQKTVSQDFPATGHVDVAQKARGTITVYNELSVSQQLIATTRFESVDHHIFHTLTSIIVPPATTTNGKLVPGNIDVQVIADKAGADYNVPVGLFTIPAFQEKGDTEKFQKVYGQSTAPIHNGTSGQSTVVTDSDLNTAKQTLTTQLTTDVQDELKSQINGLKILNDSQVVVGSPVSTSPTDATATTFTVNLSGSLKTVGFKESDLDALVVQYVDAQKNLTALPDKLTLDYSNVHWDDTKNGLSFTVHVTGQAYAKLDTAKIITDLLGKNDADMRAYLGGISGISSAHVSLSPFWVRSIPNNQDRVKVDVSY